MQDIKCKLRMVCTVLLVGGFLGVPLVQAFDIVGDGVEKPKLAQLIKEIRQDVASGNSFASAIRRHPNEFDDLFCNLVDAGESSGDR